MEISNIIDVLILILGVSGLILDILGVFKLFSVEPIQIKPINQNISNATFGDWSKAEKTEYLVKELNNQIREVNQENRQRNDIAKKYRCFIIFGFVLQCISVILAFISTFFN